MWKSFEWPKLADKKCDTLENKGFKTVGVLLENADGQRATLDRHGRVVWLDDRAKIDRLLGKPAEVQAYVDRCRG